MSNQRTRFFLRLLSSFGIAAAALIAVCSGALAQEILTANQFVGAGTYNGDGYLTVYQEGFKPHKRLTYTKFSYLTVKVNGQYYSNNDQGPGPITPTPMLNGVASKIGDTLHTVWQENGFDIVQDAFPVAFTTSGAIVISIKVVNHSTSPLDVQAQYLLDNENGSNDEAYLLHQYGYFRNWQICPPKPMPSFCLAFENPPDANDLGVVGIGYYNDTFPPRPLGLMQPSLIEYGNWPQQSLVTWGPSPAKTGTQLSDDATLIMGKQMNATAFIAGTNDSVTEIFRTAYGTPEWCFDHGNLVGIALYPQHLYWDSKSNTYTPNPFKVQTFLFNVTQNTASGVKITQNVGSPVVIKSPSADGLQNLNTITIGGFAEAHWTDSVTISPNGCVKSFPIDIHFDVAANGIPSPVFSNPWACQIQVECPHPDTIAPGFINSFVGCNPFINDTTTIQEGRLYDLGLRDITYSSPDLNTGDYTVTFSPTAPTYSCIFTPVKVFVHQVDTFKSGHVILKSTDCAGNVSNDTICFAAHKALPDLTAPVFTENTQNADCHTNCTDWTITDNLSSNTSIDRGIDQIVATNTTNMTVTGTTGKFTPAVGVTTLHVCVTDSMLDGTVTLEASDTSHNTSTQIISFCTTPDTRTPLITQSPFNASTSSWHVHITDTAAWDRGLDSVWLEDAGNVTPIGPSLPAKLTCTPTFDFDLKVDDTTKCAHGTVMAKDCKGNIAPAFKLAFTKGAKPIVTPDKMVLCSPTDSVVLTASGNFFGYQWSSGQSGNRIVIHSSGTYSVTVDDGVGCGGTSNTVTIGSSPATPQITPAGPFTLCADSTLLDAGAGFKTYQWWNGTTKIAGATLQKYMATASGTYTAQVTNAAGCDGVSQVVSITVNPIPPQPVITSSGGILNSTTATRYQWALSGNNITGATSQTYTPTVGGDYTVMIWDANGCSNISKPFNNSGSTLIALDTVYGAISSHISVPLSILTSTSVPLGSRNWHATVRFNKTMLVPEGFDSKTVQGNDLVVQYSGNTAVTQGQIKALSFTAALGTDSCTPMMIDSFWWDTPNIFVTKRNGEFCATNLCTQGGLRLFDPTAKFTLSAPRPSPVQNSVTIDYSLIETGHTTLVVTDLLGREVMRLVDADQTPGKYSVTSSTAALPNGTYIYSLRTPALVQSHHLQIAR